MVIEKYLISAASLEHLPHRIPVVSPNLINTSEEVAGGTCLSCTVRKMGCSKIDAQEPSCHGSREEAATVWTGVEMGWGWTGHC